MSFKHKLAKRLALSWRGALALAPVAVLLACDAATQTLTDPAQQVLAISPTEINTDYQQTIQFAAFLRDQAGDSMPVAVQWRATSGTITAQGLFTAGTVPGDFAVTAADDSGRTASATVGVGYSGQASASRKTARPGKVTDLAVAGVTSDAVTLRFTEVGDGTGQPAQYQVRYAAGTMTWASATPVAQGTCASPMPGTAAGAARECTVTGLNAATSYVFRLVAFRGTLSVDAVFGPLSNVASGTTSATPPPAPAPVATVTVSPASASLLVGGIQQLTATLRDSAGNLLTGRSITWASSAPLLASVSSTGLASGLLAGLSTITATSEGVTGSAALTVTATDPPPPSGSGTWPNEPTGSTVLSDYGFTDPLPLVNDGPVGSGWKILNPDNGQPLTAGHAVQAVDATAPLGSSIGQFIYPVGMRDGYAPATMYYDGFTAANVYAGFWWKPSSPWQTDGSGVNKIAFLFIGGSTMYISMNWNGSAYHLRVEDEINAPTTNYDPNVTLTPITLGQWHKVEWTVSATGGMQFWLDGVLQGSYPNVRWSGAFSMFQFSPTWGGNGGDVKRELDTYSYNHVHLSVH